MLLPAPCYPCLKNVSVEPMAGALRKTPARRWVFEVRPHEFGDAEDHGVAVGFAACLSSGLCLSKMEDFFYQKRS